MHTHMHTHARTRARARALEVDANAGERKGGTPDAHGGGVVQRDGEAGEEHAALVHQRRAVVL